MEKHTQTYVAGMESPSNEVAVVRVLGNRGATSTSQIFHALQYRNAFVFLLEIIPRNLSLTTRNVRE